MKRTLFLLTALLLGCSAPAQELSHDDVDRWLRGYESAWETRDAAAAAGLFTDDARYFETPWSEPFAGRAGIAEYWRGVTADQRDIDFEYEIIAISGATAVAHWNAAFGLASSGAELALDGVFVLEFSAPGRVSELREWWVLRP